MVLNQNNLKVLALALWVISFCFISCRSARIEPSDPVRSNRPQNTIPDSEPATPENSMRVKSRDGNNLELRRDNCDEITNDLNEGKKNPSIEIGIQRPINKETAQGYVGYRCNP